MEWHNAWGGLVVPTNWHNSQMTPFGYLTHDAQNLIVTRRSSAAWNISSSWRTTTSSRPTCS